MTAAIALPACAANERKGHAAKTNASLLIIDRYCNGNNAKNEMHLGLMVHEAALMTPPLSSGSSY